MINKTKYEKNSQDTINRTMKAIVENRQYGEVETSNESLIRRIAIIFTAASIIGLITFTLITLIEQIKKTSLLCPRFGSFHTMRRRRSERAKQFS